jgi:microcompartment protein CcmL/EutN
MANPNIVGVTAIYGATSYLVPTGTTATVWTALTPAVGSVNKVGSIVASNVTANPANITVTINSAAAGGGTAYRLVYQISVPANASLIIADKTTPFYVGETQSVVVTSGTTNAIELIASYETITA